MTTSTPTTQLSSLRQKRMAERKKAAKQFKLSDTQKTVLAVSAVWLVIGAVIVAFLLNSQAQYNRGVFDGMSKTKAILQSK